MFRTFFRFLAPVLVVIGLVACETPAPTQTFPDITFAHKPTLGLNVGSLDVTSEYVSPMASPHVEHRFPVTPEKALRQWAADRLVPKGMQGIARFTVLQAAVTETPLEKGSGLKATFTKEQTARYEAIVEAKLEIFDDKGFRRGYATARAALSRTLREDASLNDRRQLWFDMTEEVMEMFDGEMERNIREFLGGYLM